MSLSPLKTEVLKAFKSLHRARAEVFEGDNHALQLVRSQINEHFRKNKDITEKSAIKELIKFSKEVETEMRTTVVQAREVEPGKYHVRFREETVRTDNTPYRDVPDDVLLAHSRKSKRKM